MRLSICIPTHDGRGRFLREALDSILAQITPDLRGDVQICISDNASEDETQELVAGYSRDHPGLFLYHRNPVNLGFTRNLLAVVDMAQGDYCWLLSSDDAMNAGGVARVLEVLAQHPTLAGMTVFFNTLDRHLREVGAIYPLCLLPAEPDRMQLFTSPDQIFRNCGSVQGYTSAQVFDRRLWLAALEDIGRVKFTSYRYFPYLFLFGKMVKKRPSWLWLPERLINSRGDNDYLSAHLDFNLLHYHIQTMDEVSRVWGELFGTGSATYRILLRNNYSLLWNWFELVRYKARFQCRSSDDWEALLAFTRRLYFLPGFWLTAFPVLLLPHSVLRGGADVVRDLKILRRVDRLKLVLLGLRRAVGKGM